MSIPFPFPGLLQAQAATLQFESDWLAPAAPGVRPWHDWLGAYHPDRAHAIELIDRHNHAAALQALPAQVHHISAHWIIFCDAQRCPPALQDTLQARDIGVIHCSLPGARVSRSLYAALGTQLGCTQVHGNFLRIHELGVLITGPSGTGKSSLALALLDRGHALISDDVCLFYRMPHTQHVRGVCPAMLYDLLHIPELGVLNVAKLFGPQHCLPGHGLDLVIELAPDHRPAPARLAPAAPLRHELCEVNHPRYIFSPRPAQNLALLVETAVKNQVLYREGYDANAELARRQQQFMNNV